MSIHGIVMIQVCVSKPFFFDEESITAIRRSSSFNRKRCNPWLSIVFPKIITDWIVSSNESKVTVEGIITFEVGVMSLINSSCKFDVFVNLREKGGFAEVIVGT